MSQNEMSQNNNKSHITLAVIISGSLALAACKSAPVKPVEVTPPPAPAPVKTYTYHHVGDNNHISLPSKWSINSTMMPKGFVSYTVKNDDVHLTISGFETPKSTFNPIKSKKDLESVTILYWASSSDKNKNHTVLDDMHKTGSYLSYSCATSTKCYQVFPLSHWDSVIAANVQANNMRYTITGGVNDLNSETAQDLMKAIQTIEYRSSVMVDSTQP